MWPAGGELVVCARCGGVQKTTDSEWQRQAADIYANYSIYYQSSGAEQPVVDAASGELVERSARILGRFKAGWSWPSGGRLLDIGSGNGAMLRAFARADPTWRLAGSDLGDRFAEEIGAIPGVSDFYAGPVDDIPGQYDLVTMMHVLEHVPSPVAFLRSLRSRLAGEGFLLVQVPNAERNPFDLLVADHCSHFSPTALHQVLRSAGYGVATLATDWVPKELTALARLESPDESQPPPFEESGCRFDEVASDVRWLHAVVADAREVAGQGHFGLFGTSIAATWLFGELGPTVRFFVDEDPLRAGGLHMGLPVYHPSDAPANSHVLLALAPELACLVARKLAGSGSTFQVHLPPPRQG
jgi:2-polyprenyl-3-methyl-5-hydroxy-6-metoxy-1,4-benzoquinol methylase